MSKSEFDPTDGSGGERRKALDAATAARLRRLSNMPVDISRLEASIAREIPKSAMQRRNPWRISFRPLHAVAASVVVGVLAIGLVINASARPVVASAQVLEGLYHQASMAEAGTDHSVMACCIQKVKGKPVTCVALDSDGSRVSMMIAEAKDFRVPAEAQKRDAASGPYYFQATPKLNMVMAVRGDTWVCLMGPVPEGELVKILSKAPSATK